MSSGATSEKERTAGENIYISQKVTHTHIPHMASLKNDDAIAILWII